MEKDSLCKQKPKENEDSYTDTRQTHFNPKSSTRNKGGHYIMVKE